MLERCRLTKPQRGEALAERIERGGGGLRSGEWHAGHSSRSCFASLCRRVTRCLKIWPICCAISVGYRINLARDMAPVARFLSHLSAPFPSEFQASSAGRWRVTPPRLDPRFPGVSFAVAGTSAPKVARDRPPGRAPVGTCAADLVPRRDATPARACDACARASYVATRGTPSPRISSASSPPAREVGTSIHTRCSACA